MHNHLRKSSRLAQDQVEKNNKKNIKNIRELKSTLQEDLNDKFYKSTEEFCISKIPLMILILYQLIKNMFITTT
jgi:hypothetical protein